MYSRLVAAACPRCGSDVHPLTLEGVRLDQCTSCRGYWFERGALEAFVGAPLPSLLDDVVSVEMATDSGGRFLELDAGFSCPSCQAPLHELAFASEPSLHIAACNRCQGVLVEATQLQRLRKLAPEIHRAKQRDLDEPLTSNPESLQRSLANASPAEKQRAVQNALKQFERRTRPGCVLVFVLLVLAFSALMAL